MYLISSDIEATRAELVDRGRLHFVPISISVLHGVGSRSRLLHLAKELLVQKLFDAFSPLVRKKSARSNKRGHNFSASRVTT